MSDPVPELHTPSGASSVGARIFRAAVVVAGANVLVKILGLVRNQATVAWFGTQDGTTDCFLAALTIASVPFFISEECIGPAFLPIFMERRDKQGPAEAWKLASTIFNLQFLLLLVAAAAIGAFPAEILAWAAGWEEDAQKIATRGLEARAADFLRWMAPAALLLALTTMTFMLLNARKKFFWAAFGEGSFRALTIGCIVAFGSVAKLITHLPGLWGELKHYRLRLDLKHPDFRRFLVLVAPLLVGSVFAKYRDVFINVNIMSRAGLEGGITYNIIGKGVIDTLNFIVPYALSVGMFPYLCELADRGDRRALGGVLDRSSRFMLFVFLPLAAVLVVAAAPMTDLLFTMGKASRSDAALIGLVTACSALSMPFYALERVMMKGYFSDRRTTAPVVFGVITSTLNMAVCYLLVVVLAFTGRSALWVVPLAAVGTRALKVLLLGGFLKTKVPMFEVGATVRFLAKALAVTALVAAAAYGAHLAASSALPGFATVTGLKAKLLLGADLAAIGAAALAAFYVGARLLRMEELHVAERWLRPRVAGTLARLRR
jgi:putative peptidoglycan lipid II flippase